jgi:hypothetical protein
MIYKLLDKITVPLFAKEDGPRFRHGRDDALRRARRRARLPGASLVLWWLYDGPLSWLCRPARK